MPFVPVPDTVMVEMRMTCHSQKVENTLYFTGGFSDETLPAELALVMESWWTDNYAPLVSEDVTLVETVVTDLSSETGFQVSQAPALLTTGTISGFGSLPNNASLAVSFRTGQRGRAFRGRNYIVGITESQVERSEMDTTTANAWQAAYTAILDAVADLSCNWSVVSRFSGVDGDGKPIPREEGVASLVTNVVIVDRVIDSQRRRLPGRGQ